MANEPDTTPIRSLYAQRFTVDLETNRREQEAASAQIAELDARLQQLRADESWLCGMQGALPPASEGAVAAAGAVVEAGAGAGAGDGQVPAQPVRTPAIVTAALSAAAAGTPAAESVPRPRRAGKATGGAAVAKKAARPRKSAPAAPATTASGASGTPAKTAARKPAAAKATTAAKAGTTTGTAKAATTKAVTAKATPTATQGGTKGGPAKKAAPAPTATTGPPLRELVLALLVGAAEPRMVSEVTTALAQTHPGRPASTQVVRNTLETLAKKGVVDKENKQGSVMYTAPRPAAGESAAGPAASNVTADDKATAGPTGPRG
ncbi:hypothetical protein ACFWSF_33290 [Streptomyces sp. NPDC058611]|uniref:hypothetical protein n=1 Tax=unclassified Streptomyces TaxID=2593676 RepID=UPI00366726F8